MPRFEPADVQALAHVVDSITRREGTYSFLDSVKDLARVDEPDTAIDHLAGGLLGWNLSISPDEFAIIERLCHAWDTADRIDDFAALVRPDPSTDLQP
ncbi:hypothetical protein FL583_31955 [Cryptosporangium phraense]|uniref:MafI family immunity protein n=2 Tax=Cryptosporangium phraense TaxID=2593070 RepID=A0A545AI51_9ACTN|nr:hypothetical protein FL583_31955 [Cryptosporangium phraense]